MRYLFPSRWTIPKIAIVVFAACSAVAQPRSAAAALGKGLENATRDVIRGSAKVTETLAISAPVNAGVALVRSGSGAIVSTGLFLVEHESLVCIKVGSQVATTGAAVALDLSLGIAKAGWRIARPHRIKTRRPKM